MIGGSWKVVLKRTMWQTDNSTYDVCHPSE